MGKKDQILKCVRVAEDPGLITAIFNALGDLPATEYRPTERERERVRDHARLIHSRTRDQ